MPRVAVDNQEVEVVAGSNLLAAARKLGLDIPALCYHPGCAPNTACMTCVVKVAGTQRMVPACATPAEDGLRVESETDEVRTLRRTALELLLSEHCFGPPSADQGEEAHTALSGWPDCQCVKSDVCRLRKYALLYEASPTHYAGRRRATQAPEEHHTLMYDSGKCILCGICVQLASQAGEALGLTYIGRGFDTRIGAPFGEPLGRALEVSARRIAGACPTGAFAPRSTRTGQDAHEGGQ